MNAPDLRVQPPCRWNVGVSEVIWLPRLADKARAYDAGTLGTYLYGQSPVDDAFLRRAGSDYARFTAIVRRCGDDAAILTALEAQSPGATDRLRAWSRALAAKQRRFLAVLDFDDGGGRNGWQRALHRAGNLAFFPVLLVLRKRRPVRV